MLDQVSTYYHILSYFFIIGFVVYLDVPHTFSSFFGYEPREKSCSSYGKPWHSSSAAQVGHELKTSNGWSTIIASLHSDAQVPWVQVGFMEAEHLI